MELSCCKLKKIYALCENLSNPGRTPVPTRWLMELSPSGGSLSFMTIRLYNWISGRTAPPIDANDVGEGTVGRSG